jgi:hypothetical protein
MAASLWEAHRALHDLQGRTTPSQSRKKPPVILTVCQSGSFAREMRKESQYNNQRPSC